MNTKQNVTITAKQDKLLTTAAAACLNADGDLLAAILTVSDEHAAFKGLNAKAVKAEGTVTVNMNSHRFAGALAAAGKLDMVDKLTKKKDSQVISHSDNYGEADLDVRVIDKEHALFEQFVALKSGMVASIMKAQGWSRQHAGKAIDDAWLLRKLSLKQRLIKDGDARKLSGLEVIAADDKLKQYAAVAKEAYGMVRDAVNPDSKAGWQRLAKILRQMEKEATKNANA